MIGREEPNAMTQRLSETKKQYLERRREYRRSRPAPDRSTYMRGYRLKNLERERARTKEWRSDPVNRHRLYARMKVYSKTAKARVARNELQRRKRETNLNYRIKEALRSRINSAIKGLNKSARTRELVGCDAEFLRLYISAQFQKGMTWANWGKWHIDHIIPCAEFDLRKPDQQRKCFHYSNLRPLWAKENLMRKHRAFLWR